MGLIEIKHPKTGRVVQVRYEGNSSPAPDQLKSLFDAPATITGVVPQKTEGEQVQEIKQPILDTITKTVGAGPAGIVPALSRGYGKIKKGLSQMAGPSLSPLAQEALTQGRPLDAADEIGMPTGPLGIGGAGRQPNSDIEQHGNFGKGLLNVGAGAAEGLLGLVLGLTPAGAGFAGAHSTLNQLPKGNRDQSVGDISNFLTSPASSMDVAGHLGVKDPEAAGNLNLLGDIAAQGGAVHALRGGNVNPMEIGKRFIERQRADFANAGQGDILGTIMPNGEKLVQAAIKIGGKIFTGNSHAAAFEEAQKAGVLSEKRGDSRFDFPDYTEGFAGNKGGFFTRDESVSAGGPRMSEKPGSTMQSSIIPDTPMEIGKRFIERQRADFANAGQGDLLGSVMPNGEKIIRAAVKFGDQVFTGNSHAEAWDKARQKLGYETMAKLPSTDGFVTDKNSFYDRETTKAQTLAASSDRRGIYTSEQLPQNKDIMDRIEGARLKLNPEQRNVWGLEMSAGLGAKDVAKALRKGAKNVVEEGAFLPTAEGSKDLKALYKGDAEAGSLRPDNIYYLERGGGIPVSYVTQNKGTALRRGDVIVGKPGEVHRDMYRGLKGMTFDDANQITRSTNVIEGRVGGNGSTLSLWGDPSDYNANHLADMVMELVTKKKLSPDARVYFSEGKAGGIRIRDLGDSGAQLSSIPGVSGDALKKTIDTVMQLHLANGGSTVDPRTGEELNPKGMAGVSPYGQRSLVIDGRLTKTALDEYIRKNGDLLSQDDHYVGTWYDKKDKKTYVDVTVALPKDRAEELGKAQNQKAVFDYDTKRDIPTGGTGEAIPGPEFDYAAYREKNLPPEERAALEAQRKSRLEKPIFSQRFGEQENQIEASKRAIEYGTGELGLKPMENLEDTRAAAKRFEDVFGPDLEAVKKSWDDYEAQTGQRREPWYGGWNKAKPILAKHFPELKQPTKAKLFGWAMNVFANGDSPSNEFVNGIAAWERYRKAGRFEALDKKDDFIGNVRANTWSAHLEELQGLIDLKGEAGAVKWLETKHTISELNTIKDRIRSKKQMYDDEGNPIERETVIPQEYGQKQPMEGAYIFGPKMGAYGLNKEGISGPVTMDKWMNVAYKIARGVLRTDFKKDPISGEKVEVLHGTNVLSERKAMRTALTNLGQKYGISPEDAQALLWVHVIRPFFSEHGQIMKGGEGHHGDFARYLDESGWLNRRVRGTGATLEEAGKIAREKGLSEAAQRGPEQYRPKPKGNTTGDANEGGGGDTSFEFGDEEGVKK